MSESKNLGFFIEREQLIKNLKNFQVTRWQIYTRSPTREFFEYQCDYYCQEDVDSDTELYKNDGVEVRVLFVSYPWDMLYDKDQIKENKDEDLYPLHFVLQQSGHYFSNLQFTTFDNGKRVFIYDSGEFKEENCKEKLLELSKFFDSPSI